MDNLTIGLIILVIVILLIVLSTSKSNFSSGGVLSTSAIAMYDRANECFIGPDGEPICIRSGLLML